MAESKPAHHRQPYTDVVLREILSRPPTRSNVAHFAKALGRTEDAIKLIYDVAATRRAHLDAAMMKKAFWRQVRRVAAELGWTTVGRRESVCPQCHSSAVLKIVYGDPDPKTIATARQRGLAIGGCVVVEGQPLLRCGSCGYEWGGKDPPSPGTTPTRTAVRRGPVRARVARSRRV